MAVTATGFITDAVLSAALKDVIQRTQGSPGSGYKGKGAAGDLMAYWASIVTRANQAAYQEILRRLTERGFDFVTQIQLWDHGAEFQTAIGVWWCLVHGAALATDSYQAQALDKEKQQLDRRWELKECAVIVTISGVPTWQNPGTGIGEANTGPNDLLCGYYPGKRVPDDTWPGYNEWPP